MIIQAKAYLGLHIQNRSEIMKNLIIYDTSGYIISRSMGDVREPIGIPFMWVDVPEGKYVENIDVSGTKDTPIFADLPKSQMQLMQEQINELTITLGDALLNGGV